TRVRGLASVPDSPGRRRRRGVASTATPRVVDGGPRSSTGTAVPVPPSGRMQTLAWILVASAVLVIALAATATYVLIKTNTSSIPAVTDIQADERQGRMEFSWPDPGLEDGDSYQIETADGERSIQRAPRFAVDGNPGELVCITVSVNRAGVNGPLSNQKCASFLP